MYYHNAMPKLSPKASELKPSPTLAIEAKAKAMRAQGADILSFSVGEPDFDTPAHIKKAAQEAMAAGFTKYTPASGIPELKAAVAKAVSRSAGADFSPNQVVISCGAKHSIASAIFALVGEGEEVLVPAPYWVSYPVMAKLAGGVPRIVYPDGTHAVWESGPAHLPAAGLGFKLSPKALKAGINPKTRAVILNYPSNPSGAVYSAGELKELAAVLKDSGAVVISDEIYSALVYDEPFSSLASVAPELLDRIVIVNGVSKTYSMTGWRIGWAAGPAEIIAAIGNLQSQTTSNPVSISQKAALAALEGPQECVEEMRQEFEKRRNLIVSGFNKFPGVKCSSPGGAFYIFPDFRELLARPSAASALGLDGGQAGASSKLCSYLLDEAKVAAVPGAEFGYECHVRFSFAASEENIKKALGRIEAALAKLVKD